MKEIKAFIPVRRIAAVTEALRLSGVCDINSAGTGCHNVTVSHVQRLLTSDDPALQQYSVDLAELVVAEAKLELVCADELVDDLLSVISKAAKTRSARPGWIFVSDIVKSIEIRQGA